jgi:hypothetical protein
MKGNNMKTSQSKNSLNRSLWRRGVFLLGLALACFGLSPAVQAVVPAPDGFYPTWNTAEGQDALFSRTTGNFNTAIGAHALFSNSDGTGNTAVGAFAMAVNTGGDQNVAVGQGALGNNNGFGNVAAGFRALVNNTTSGNSSQAFGFEALFHQTDGLFNNGFGWRALYSNVHGDNNTAMGDGAGFQITGSGNVDFGAGVGGVAGESDTTRIRNILNTFQPFQAGVVGFVTVGPGNKLGNGSFSSRRYKDDIKPMDKASEEIFALNPVSFRYKKEFEPTHSQQYGLIAEDVVKVDPNLAVYDEEGKVRSVRYDLISNMLLNEFLKEHKKVEEQQASIAELKSSVALQQREMQVLTAQLKEQAAQLQKVSAQLEVGKPAPQVVANH